MELLYSESYISIPFPRFLAVINFNLPFSGLEDTIASKLAGIKKYNLQLRTP